MFQEDYVTRMIKDFGRIISALLGKKDSDIYIGNEEELTAITDEMSLSDSLIVLANIGEINKAENMLFEDLDFSSIGNIETALRFYTHLNSFDDEKLELGDYSRQEIFEGISECAKKFGMDENILKNFSV